MTDPRDSMTSARVGVYRDYEATFRTCEPPVNPLF